MGNTRFENTHGKHYKLPKQLTEMNMKQKKKRPELWGGIECTINRLTSGYRDQLEYNGHYNREGDIDAIADLGITTLRYPVLWERHQPVKGGDIDFSWVATRLNQLRKHNVNPIAGLVHHGSGPEYTNLLDPEFPQLLAAYAGKVAAAFPWIQMYTPVNEPLTTARFSGMYGFWYPHIKSEKGYLQMLLNQLKGTVLAMWEIRKINPEALLVQTEDLGKTYSTPLLAYQAEKENQRRFYTQDILCGRLDHSHPSWYYFMKMGIDAAELQFFLDNPCPPDILGVNYYCTSERYLDENMHRYPESRHGGNDYHRYADVEAVRARLNETTGFEVLTKELWDRYQIPIAVTEAHLNCSREEQMKWFLDIYESSCNLQEKGVEIKAVTAWSVLGSYGWNHLLMGDEMHYERGLFDVSSGRRRPTAMAKVIKTLAETGTFSSPAVHGNGWWKKETRYFGDRPEFKNIDISPGCSPILIIGKTGTLGKAFNKVCNIRSLPHVLLGRQEMDITNGRAIEAAIQKYNPWAVINAAGYVRVDDAENDEARCYLENTKGPELLAVACKKYGIQFMTFSSDLVFNGDKKQPYLESDLVNPLNVYGKSKAGAEDAVLAAKTDSLVIRTSAFFSPWDEYNFAHAVLKTIGNGMPFHASPDVISPTYVPHLVNAALDLLIDQEHGIWHLSNHTPVSWYEFAKLCAERAGMNPALVIEHRPALPALRPAYAILGSEKGLHMPPLQMALDEYFSEVLLPAYT